MLPDPSSRRTVSQSHRWGVEVGVAGKQQQGSYWRDGLGSLWGLTMVYLIAGRLTKPGSLEDGAWKGKVSCIEAADRCKDSDDSCRVLGRCRTGSHKMIVAVEPLRLYSSDAVDFSMCPILSTELSTWKNPSGLLEVDNMTLVSYCCHLMLASEPPRMTTGACPVTLSQRVYEH